eukprot:TRINITY_DN2710_c0_g1_i1.p1 TRINITY_DN2710_c0_g1~~TRINITY_DN2710_c0_g1_i1.p1  ORF type:complete len:371 (-),score=90.06 TRINITY_DN2710_c0_g1_i1:32-1144(-)
MESKHKQVTYWDYLHLNELLSIQQGRDEDESSVSNDELNFIIVHQTLELWFKLVLKELRLARDELSAAYVNEDKIPFVVHHLSRVIEIFKLAKDHFSIMETLTPQDFLAFRGKLGTASGFQSFQLRQIEIVMGLKSEDLITMGEATALQHLQKNSPSLPGGNENWQKIEDTKKEVNLSDALLQWLYRTPIQGSKPTDPKDEEIVQGFVNEYLASFKKLQMDHAEIIIADNMGQKETVTKKFESIVQATSDYMNATDIKEEEQRKKTIRIRAAIVFIESYRDLPLLAWPRLLLDKIIEFEESFIIFRSRHARMVEREIGRRIGTGGSSGVDYLDATTRYRVYKDLWGARTALIPSSALPELKNNEFYRIVK